MKKTTKTAYGFSLNTTLVDNNFVSTIKNSRKLIYKRVSIIKNPTSVDLVNEHQAALVEFYAEYKTASMNNLRINTTKTIQDEK